MLSRSFSRLSVAPRRGSVVRRDLVIFFFFLAGCDRMRKQRSRPDSSTAPCRPPRHPQVVDATSTYRHDHDRERLDGRHVSR
jgi:hypothetical protein